MATWDGWAELAGNGRITSSPSVNYFGPELYTFVRGVQDRIFYNRRPNTDPSWSGWTEVPGDARTSNSPAFLSYLGFLYLFVVGEDFTINYNVFDNEAWRDWREVGGNGRTSHAPAVAILGWDLYIFVTGVGDFIYYNKTSDGVNWSGWVEIPGGGKSLSGPAVAAYNDQLLVFKHSEGTGPDTTEGTPGHIDFTTFTNNTWSGTWSELPGAGETTAGPAATSRDNKIYVVVRGVEDRIFCNQWDGRDWSGWAEARGNGRTIYSPSAVVLGNSTADELHIVVHGVEDRVFENVGHFPAKTSH